MEDASVMGSASRRSSGEDVAEPVGVISPDAVVKVAELASSSIVLWRESIVCCGAIDCSSAAKHGVCDYAVRTELVLNFDVQVW
jgi:hypothetical protein